LDFTAAQSTERIEYKRL